MEAATDFAADGVEAVALADHDHVAYTAAAAAAAADTELVAVLAVQTAVAEVGHQI